MHYNELHSIRIPAMVKYPRYPLSNEIGFARKRNFDYIRNDIRNPFKYFDIKPRNLTLVYGKV